MSLENASCGSEHKCFGALDAHFIGYQHNAVLITCLYVSDYKIVGRALKWAQCNARGGAHNPGEQVYIIEILRMSEIALDPHLASHILILMNITPTTFSMQRFLLSCFGQKTSYFQASFPSLCLHVMSCHFFPELARFSDYAALSVYFCFL